jgi:glycosyltransferase involved in cell wall biosynthesis
MNKPLCVVSAPPDTYSGYGARSRDFIRALVDKKGAEWDIKILLQRWGNLPFGYIGDHKEEWSWMIKHLLPNNQLTQQPDYWFQITVPNEFQPVGKWNCGVTAGIETTICHQSWLEGCNRMNLVLVSSNHAKTVFEQTKLQMQNAQSQIVGTLELKTPTEVLFEGVNTEVYKYIPDQDLEDTALIRSLDEIEEDFCFLFVGHWLQGAFGEDRKNVGLTIKSFIETFKNRKKKPALVLKVTGGGASILDRDEILNKIDSIRNAVPGSLPNIYLIHGEFSEEEINNLYNHGKIKAMISFTKGEGFGRPLLEFTQSKKPLIVSAWSGHLDFLSPEFTTLVPGTLTQIHPSAVVDGMLIRESSWFSVDVLSTNRALVEIYENYSKYEELAKRQAFKLKKEFSREAMADLLEKYLTTAPKYQPLNLPKLPSLSLPKLKKIE